MESSLTVDGRRTVIMIRPVTDGPVCIILVSSSWLHVVPASGVKVSKSLGTGMLEGQSLYLLKLAPRILMQICCSLTSYILVTVSIYRNNVKRMAGWVTIFHCYNLPLLHGWQLFLQFPNSPVPQQFHTSVSSLEAVLALSSGKRAQKSALCVCNRRKVETTQRSPGQVLAHWPTGQIGPTTFFCSES